MARVRVIGEPDPFLGIIPKDGTDDPDRGTRSLILPDDIATLALIVRRTRAAVVVIDPLMAHVSVRVNTHRDQDVRQIVAPLAEMARRMNVAVIVVRHMTKSPGGSPLYRGGGSIGIMGQARLGLLVARDPDDDGRAILTASKTNVGMPPPSLAFRIVTSVVDVDDRLVETAKVEWLGESSLSAETILARQGEDSEERSARSDVKDWLQEVLADGPKLATDMAAEARALGFAERTVKRAKKDLGIRSLRDGLGGKVSWGLDSIEGHETHSGPAPERGTQWGEVAPYASDADPETPLGMAQRIFGDDLLPYDAGDSS